MGKSSIGSSNVPKPRIIKIDRTKNTGPNGPHKLLYADYVASGRALKQVEEFVFDHVLPYYANTHTETSYTGARTTALREEARAIIRASVNGTAADKVIFCGAGATAAINKLVDILNLRLPADLSDRHGLADMIPDAERPVVFIGPYEHHSNELPWRESIAEVVAIPLDSEGQIDATNLEAQLARFASRKLLIGPFVERAPDHVVWTGSLQHLEQRGAGEPVLQAEPGAVAQHDAGRIVEWNERHTVETDDCMAHGRSTGLGTR